MDPAIHNKPAHLRQPHKANSDAIESAKEFYDNVDSLELEINGQKIKLQKQAEGYDVRFEFQMGTKTRKGYIKSTGIIEAIALMLSAHVGRGGVRFTDL